MCFCDQKKAKGEELFEQIMYHLDIVEKDYFGLRFMDSAQVPVRLDMPFTQQSPLISCFLMFVLYTCFIGCLISTIDGKININIWIININMLQWGKKVMFV